MVEMKLLPTSTKGNVRKLESRQVQPVLRQRFPGKVEVNLKHFNMSELEEIACSLKNSNITTLRLSCSGPGDTLRFSVTDPTTSHILLRFFRELAQALGAGGWLKHLELGFKPWKRDLRVLSQAIGCSITLQRLSLANTSLGDAALQLLAQGLCNCPPLQILDLSGCALSDSSHVPLASILKASVGLNAEAEWQSSLRECESDKGRTKIPGLGLRRGLHALDLSFNFLSDTAAKHICHVLRLGAPLAALKLQGNQMQGKSMIRFLSIFEMWGILRIVDLRDNLDKKRVGVLENGEHLSSFSTTHEPFWKTNWSHGGLQILKGCLTTSQVLTKEQSSRSRANCVSGFNEIDYVDGAVTQMENQVLANSKRFRSNLETKQTPSPGSRSLSLSPLPNDVTESADLIPRTILPSVKLGSKEKIKHLETTTTSLSPPCNYLSTPTEYSDYVDMCEEYPDADLSSDWKCCRTSVSTDDTQTNDLSFSPSSPSYRTCDQLLQQPNPHADQNNNQILSHSTLNCKMSKCGRQDPDIRRGLDAETSTVSEQLRAAQLSEARCDDSEWDAFMNDMVKKLLHVQDGLDVVISSAKPDFLITAQTAMTTLKEGLQQLLPLET